MATKEEKIIGFKKLFAGNKERLVPVVFVLLILIFYGNTLKNDFVLDDIPAIAENRYLTSLRYLPEIITGCALGAEASGCKGYAIYYRPIQNLSYLLTRQISAQPWLFHLLNLAYFFTAASLVFVLVRYLTKNFLTAFLAGIIFIIHPVNNEVANWISAISESSFIVFNLLALIYYFKYREGGVKRHLFIVYLFYFLALLSKEPSLFTIPLLVLAVDLIYFKLPLKKLFSLREGKRYLCFLLPMILYFVLRILSLGGILGPVGGALVAKPTLAERIYAFFHLFALSFKELLFPYPMIFFHEFSLKTDLFNFSFLAAFLFVAGFSYLLYFFYKRGNKIVSISLSWIFIFLLPNLMFFNFSGENVFFSRYLFGASIGIALLGAYLLDYLWESKNIYIQNKRKRIAGFQKYFSALLAPIQPQKKRRTIVLLFTAVCLSVSLFTVFARNKVWKDDPTLILTDISVNPDAQYANWLRSHLAYYLTSRGDVNGAINLYEDILKRNDPAYVVPAYSSLANCYQIKGDSVKAEEYYVKAAESSGNGDYTVFNNLGSFYMEKGENIKAILNFCRAITIEPQAAEPQYNMSRLADSFSEMELDFLPLLYNEITSGMQKDGAEKIVYKQRTCSEKDCLFVFTAGFSRNEIVLPFLILGHSSSNDIFKAEEPSFNYQTGEIKLSVPLKYKDKTFSFIFPTCAGTYYDVQVSQ